MRGDQRMYELIHLKQGEVEEDRERFENYRFLRVFFLYLRVFEIIVFNWDILITFVCQLHNRDRHILGQ